MSQQRTPRAQLLPVFPWDLLDTYKEKANLSGQKVINLTVGSPVDPVSQTVQNTVAASSGFSGYPTVQGSKELHEALIERLKVTQVKENTYHLESENILPVIGTKEAIAGIVRDLGIPSNAKIMIPHLAYPTYEVAARLAQCEPVFYDPCDSLTWDSSAVLIFINSPSNPTGAVLSHSELSKLYNFGKKTGAFLISDECYIDLGWQDSPPLSLLSVCPDKQYTNILSVYSLSKNAHLASYRMGFFIGDPSLIAELSQLRRHTGLMVPHITQQAATVALGDMAFLEVQKKKYGQRREKLRAAFEKIGYQVDASQAGLYLWLTKYRDCWIDVLELAEQGILVAPGVFYGPKGRDHIRVSLTTSDDNVDRLVQRLS